MARPEEPADQPPTTGALDATPPAAGPVETTPPPRPGAAGVTGAGPWPADPAGFGPRAPSYQIRTLSAAGNVLAHRGEEEACRAVLAELRTAYDEYVGYLQEAGLQPGEIATWRQEQMAAAQPVTELQARGIISVDDVSGREVRNPQDERLGSVDDLIFDPETGEVSYAVVARGGFFGIGEEYVAVPWEQFAIAPGLNVLVLNIDAAQLEQAPAIDPDRFADPQVFTENRERTDEFWRQHRES
jgi:sporulation protein YlmC with PRC-barrel domain